MTTLMQIFENGPLRRVSCSATVVVEPAPDVEEPPTPTRWASTMDTLDVDIEPEIVVTKQQRKPSRAHWHRRVLKFEDELKRMFSRVKCAGGQIKDKISPSKED